MIFSLLVTARDALAEFGRDARDGRWLAELDALVAKGFEEPVPVCAVNRRHTSAR